jgi:hypothetical protein
MTKTNMTGAIFALLGISLLSTRATQAQPASTIDLGVLDMSGTTTSPSMLTISTGAFTTNTEVKWYKFTIPSHNTATSFVDIFTSNSVNIPAGLVFYNGNISSYGSPGTWLTSNYQANFPTTIGISSPSRYYPNTHTYGSSFFVAVPGSYYFAAYDAGATTPGTLNNQAPWGLQILPNSALPSTGFNITFGSGSTIGVAAPEPGTLALITLGSMGLITRLRRNKRVI